MQTQSPTCPATGALGRCCMMHLYCIAVVVACSLHDSPLHCMFPAARSVLRRWVSCAKPCRCTPRRCMLHAMHTPPTAYSDAVAPVAGRTAMPSSYRTRRTSNCGRSPPGWAVCACPCWWHGIRMPSIAAMPCSAVCSPSPQMAAFTIFSVLRLCLTGAQSGDAGVVPPRGRRE